MCRPSPPLLDSAETTTARRRAHICFGEPNAVKRAKPVGVLTPEVTTCGKVLPTGFGFSRGKVQISSPWDYTHGRPRELLLEVGEGVVRPDPGIVRLRRLRRLVAERLAHGLDRDAVVLRDLGERAPEHPQAEPDAAAAFEFRLEFPEGRVGPVPDRAVRPTHRDEGLVR